MTIFTNPVLPGFHPDPSVCRVGNDYFLVTSSFAYFPGLPIHRSTDLVSWELIGHVLNDPKHLHLDGLETSFGIWAPTIRNHNGIFYVVYSVARHVSDMTTFVTTADSAVGPWSTPTPLDADGFDPSLFFDIDGRAWFTACRDSADQSVSPGEIWIQEFDIDSLRLIGPRTAIWQGALTGAWVEAPHLVKRGATYTLLAAEGGTERHHAVTAASASSVTGPYVTDPRSPLLTHRHLGASSEIQNVGHADLVDTPDGHTYAVALGVRVSHGFHLTGRETFLVPVAWDQERPVFAPGVGQVQHHEKRPYLPDLKPNPGPGEWMSLRGPVEVSFLDEATIELRPNEVSLAELLTPAMVATPQTQPVCHFQARVGKFDEGSAGLVAYQSENRFVTVEIQNRADGLEAVLTSHSAGSSDQLAARAVTLGVSLFISCDGLEYRLGTIDGKGRARVLGSVPARFLSTEDAGGFVGTVLGVVAFGPASAPKVRFEEIEYSSGMHSREITLLGSSA